MPINETFVTIINSILDGTKVGIYINNILLTIGGIAGATLLYFVIMFYYTKKTYKEEQLQTKILIEQNKKIDEIYEKIINKNE